MERGGRGKWDVPSVLSDEDALVPELVVHGPRLHAGVAHHRHEIRVGLVRPAGIGQQDGAVKEESASSWDDLSQACVCVSWSLA